MKRILVIEDTTAIANLLKTMLEGIGCAVDMAGSISEAEGMLAAGQYDLVTLDLRIRGGSAVALKAAIRGSSPQAKIVVISGSVREEDRDVECDEIGADAEFGKPFSTAALVEKIRELLAQADTSG